MRSKSYMLRGDPDSKAPVLLSPVLSATLFVSTPLTTSTLLPVSIRRSTGTPGTRQSARIGRGSPGSLTLFTSPPAPSRMKTTPTPTPGKLNPPCGSEGHPCPFPESTSYRWHPARRDINRWRTGTRCALLGIGMLPMGQWSFGSPASRNRRRPTLGYPGAPGGMSQRRWADLG
jgi:hypothetical protein